jgi:hypothetical protein
MNRKFWALLCIVSVSVLAFAMDWPAAGGIIVSNFGSNDNGVPVQGNSFRSTGPVYPAEMGELVFYQDFSNSASRFPSPLGSWIALDHGDNIVGLYSRIKDKNGERITTILEKGTVLAESGRSGWTREDGFFFAFFDRRERRWINPSLIITPLEDDRPPVIRQVELRGVSGTTINPAQNRNVPQGTYVVYVDAYDMISSSGESLAPNRIICTVNGSETEELKFEFMAAKDGKRMVYRNGLVNAEQVYHSPPGYEAGTVRLSRGQATLSVEVRDIAENSRNVSYRLTVE